MKCYLFTCNVLKHSAWACTEKDERPLGHELIPEIVLNNSLGFPLYLKIYGRNQKIIITNDNISEIKNLWCDMQPNVFAFPLMSMRLKDLIEDYLTGEEEIFWVPVDIIGPNEKRVYYIPKFTKDLDVLNEKKTLFGDPFGDIKSVIIPYFAKEKIWRYSMFTCSQYLWQITSRIFVNENIKKAIQKAKFTGVEFEEARVE